MQETERIAYICRHKDCVPPHRVFLMPGDPVPACPAGHGKTMQRQTNLQYKRPDTSVPVGKSQMRRK